MKKKFIIKGTIEGWDHMESDGKQAHGTQLEGKPHEGIPEDGWKKAEEELYSDLGI